MEIKRFVLGDYAANCYVVTDDTVKKAAVIDPGLPSDEVNEALVGYELEYILLTHGHFDHIYGSTSLKNLYPEAKLCIHKADEICLNDSERNLAGNYEGLPFLEADMVFDDGEVFTFGDITFKAVHTPGHSEGSVCFVDDDNKIIFSGDTLFCLTVGRTDFIGGDNDKMIESVRLLSRYDDDYIVYPGHNRDTSIGFERKRNRCMRRL